MDAVISTAARMLAEADSSLEHASVGKIISTGLLLGMVHVLTGPDHLSALAAMATGGSFKAFALGVRWGCGHSLGLLIMAGIFFAAGQTIDLDAVGEYLNYVVGVFMIGLGVWTGRSIYNKYQQRLADDKNSASCDDLEANVDSNRSYASQLNSSSKLPTAIEFNPEPRRVTTAVTSTSSSVPGGRADHSPASSFFLVVNSKDSDSNDPGTPVMAMSPKSDDEPEEPKTFKEKYCTNMSFENPMMQRVRHERGPDRDSRPSNTNPTLFCFDLRSQLFASASSTASPAPAAFWVCCPRWCSTTGASRSPTWVRSVAPPS
jgi:hypothetical protein